MAITDNVIEAHDPFATGVVDHLLQQCFAVLDAATPQVVAVRIEQVECEIGEPILLLIGKSIVECVDVRDPALIRDRDLTVEDNLTLAAAPRKSVSHRTPRWRELDSNLQFRARAVSVLPLRDQMLASSSSSGEPGESPFSRPGHFREAADNYDCTGRGQPAPHTPSPDRRMAISRGGSYAQTTPRTSTSPTPITRPRRGEGAAAT
jgi:hypothetical protein